MEGKFYILDTNTPFDKHVHVIFQLNNHKYLQYHDTRKFGKMIVLDNQVVNNYFQSKVLKAYNNMNLQKTYLVNKEGKILKEFKYSDCWLSGIVIDSDEIEDRYTTFDDFTVFDKKKKILIIFFHFYLNWCRILCQFLLTKMIKENNNS